MANNPHGKTIARLERLFKSNTNFIDRYSFLKSGIKLPEFEAYSKAYNIDVSLDTVRGLITLWQNDTMLDIKKLKLIHEAK